MSGENPSRRYQASLARATSVRRGYVADNKVAEASRPEDAVGSATPPRNTNESCRDLVATNSAPTSKLPSAVALFGRRSGGSGSWVSSAAPNELARGSAP